MALDLTAASSQYLEVDTAPVVASPFTVACWVNPKDITEEHALIWIGDKDVNDNWWLLVLRGNAAGDPVRFETNDSGTFRRANTSTGFSANEWQAVMGVATADNDRAVFLNGGGKGTNTSTANPDNADRISIGRKGDSTPADHADALIAEVVVWDVALTDADAASHASGIDPYLIRPNNIVRYNDLIRDINRPNIGAALTAFNTPGVAAHPGIIYRQPVFAQPLAAAAAAASIVVLRRRYEGY